MVMMRSLLGIALESTFSKVVFPPPVPPEMSILRRARTAAETISARAGVRVPNAKRSSMR